MNKEFFRKKKAFVTGDTDYKRNRSTLFLLYLGSEIMRISLTPKNSIGKEISTSHEAAVLKIDISKALNVHNWKPLLSKS